MNFLSLSDGLRFHEILFQRDAENFSFLYCKTKKALFTDPIFSNGFELAVQYLKKFSVKVLFLNMVKSRKNV